MARNFVHTLFSPGALARQAAAGSRSSYARMTEGADGSADELSEAETGFIAMRDSFYMASVTPDGWPYIQHRGGPAGFLKLVEGNQLGFADYRGNRQYISSANFDGDARVALFLMDYPNRRRLKLIGRVTMIELADDPALVTGLMPEGTRAVPERAMIIDVTGFDWNCPQHITPRFSEDQIARAVAPLNAELARLRLENDQLRQTIAAKGPA